jgi:hypothetical protein
LLKETKGLQNALAEAFPEMKLKVQKIKIGANTVRLLFLSYLNLIFLIRLHHQYGIVYQPNTS